MKTFSQQKRKLEKIFNNIKSTNSVLDNNKNNQEILNFFKTNISQYIPIEDTGWIGKSADVNDLKTITKGALLPESLSVDYTNELEIPELLLPYIDFKLLIKTPPDSMLSGYHVSSTENYIGNYLDIEGDGGLIYKLI